MPSERRRKYRSWLETRLSRFGCGAGQWLLACPQSFARLHALTHGCTTLLTMALTLAHTHTRTHARTLSHMNAHARTLSHMNAHARTHARAKARLDADVRVARAMCSRCAGWAAASSSFAAIIRSSASCRTA
eukprot:3518011-Pleurochrysis_carterae.AAC.1